ncbi:MAG: AMP-binding protein [Sandaracinaceae bacterium]|nr:AMP-binding protein [Sandaracinaceae bacterium]
MDELFASLSAPDDGAALAVGDGALSRRQLARACKAHLDGLDAAPGDRVAVWTHPTLATPVVLAAHAAAGIVSVPLNPKLGATELDHILRDAAPRHVVDPRDVSVATDGAGRAGGGALPSAPVDDAPMLVLYTSGTTGPPKGAVLTRRNVAFDLDALADAWGWTAEDTVVHALPLFHVHGLVLGLFGALRVGGALAWSGRFEPLDVARALDAHPSAVLFGVPTMYHRLAEAAEADPTIARSLGRARLLISGSAGLPVREHRRIEALTGRGVLERYGLTETLIDCGVRADGGPRPGSVGPPLRGIELKLVDDARAVIDAHDDATLGEIAVRGPNVFPGYLNRPDATAKVVDDEGWFYTGDLATRAADGSVRIVGRRATDLIKTGGFKVGAGEVEAAILEHPAVREVAVVGLPDDDLGERIVAFVVAREPVEADALVERVATELTPHKRPREVRFVDALPRNAMGKVMKRQLHEP